MTLEPTSLTRALGQNEQVKDKVEECAADLSSVNAVLKQEVAEGGAPHEVERAVSQNEEVEVKVQECADDLAVVNTALTEEIDERRTLERDLSRSKAALSESKAQEKKSRRLALHDAVTGLANLTLFNDRLSHALAQAQRHRWRLAVMFIDLDDFKNVNDTYGHDVGDRVLQVVAQRLRASVRGGDTVSRRGGDEFLFLMLEAGDERQCRRTGRQDHRQHRRGVRRRGRERQGETQHRDRALSRGWTIRAGPAQECRHGDVRRQAAEEGLPALQPGRRVLR